MISSSNKTGSVRHFENASDYSEPKIISILVVHNNTDSY